MRHLFLLTILLLTGTAFSQTSLKAGAKVNGIALAATREQVIRKLGKPLSQTKKEAEPCVGGTEMVLKYPGLALSLWSDVEGKKFSVGYFEVTSAKWNVSGIKVGDSSAAVRKRFGRRDSQEIDGHTKSADLVLQHVRRGRSWQHEFRLSARQGFSHRSDCTYVLIT